MAGGDWEAFRAKWRRCGARALPGFRSGASRRADCQARAAFYLSFADCAALAACSRASLTAAAAAVSAIRADATRGCGARAVPVAGRPRTGAPFPEGFAYAARVRAPPAYAAFAEGSPDGDVRARVGVAWVPRLGGWGLFAREALDAGARVVDYTGDLVGAAAARDREADGGPTYVLSVVEHSFDDSAPAWRTAVDATVRGGVARFANHACDPNCVVRPTRATRSQLLPTLSLFTRTRVADGDELTFDYGGGSHADADDDDVAPAGPAVERTATPCLCGAPACRGWLLRHAP